MNNFSLCPRKKSRNNVFTYWKPFDAEHFIFHFVFSFTLHFFVMN